MAIPFKYLLLQAFACKLYFKVNLQLFKLFFGQLLLFIERKPLSTLPHNFSEKAKFTLKFISELLSDFLISKNFGRGSKRKIEFWIITFSLSKQPCICFSHFVDVLLTYLINFSKGWTVVFSLDFSFCIGINRSRTTISQSFLKYFVGKTENFSSVYQ